VRRSNGQLLLIGLLLAVFALNMNRAPFLSEASPVFLVKEEGKVTVELGPGFPYPGIHQFIDGTTRADVIKLTDAGSGYDIAWLGSADVPIQAGERFDLEEKTTMTKEVSAAWMDASKRIALGVPLHPDRMSREDWEVLPGIGSTLAARIEINRQKYGEFGSFKSLLRVSGIGEKRLSRWNQYFFTK
jgi:competence protein ComEA